jgi:hypothetical protein
MLCKTMAEPKPFRVRGFFLGLPKENGDHRFHYLQVASMRTAVDTALQDAFERAGEVASRGVRTAVIVVDLLAKDRV